MNITINQYNLTKLQLEEATSATEAGEEVEGTSLQMGTNVPPPHPPEQQRNHNTKRPTVVTVDPGVNNLLNMKTGPEATMDPLTLERTIVGTIKEVLTLNNYIRLLKDV